MSKAAEYFAGLPVNTKGSVDGIETAVDVLGATTANLKAAGVFPFGIALALAFEIKKIADAEEWSDQMRQDMLGDAIIAHKS